MKIMLPFTLTFSVMAIAQVPMASPLFENSIVSTEIDYIWANDTDAFVNLTYVGREDKEMPDSRNDELFDQNTFIFSAAFITNRTVEIWCHSDFDSRQEALEYANKVALRLGKLPDFMRDELSHVVIHKGDEGAFAEAEAQFFVLYSDNIDTRIANNDLEETVFHESVHAVLDRDHIETSSWKDAQTNDGNFITQYAKDRSNKEDLAETALFVYTMLRKPGRLSNTIEDWVNTYIPNRFAYIQNTIFTNAVLTVPSVEIGSSTDSTNFRLHSNPVKDDLQFTISMLNLKKNKILLYDMYGREVFNFNAVIGLNTIAVDHLSKGVYWMYIHPKKMVKIVLD